MILISKANLSSEGKRIRGSRGVKLRKARMARTHGLCEHCKAKGLTVLATVVNHIQPLALGGEDVDGNTENLCKACDDKVTAKQFNFKPRLTYGLDGWPTNDNGDT